MLLPTHPTPKHGTPHSRLDSTIPDMPHIAFPRVGAMHVTCASLGQVDPPPFCTQDGRATSIEQLNRAMERNLLARTPGSAVKAWRWKEVCLKLPVWSALVILLL